MAVTADQVVVELEAKIGRYMQDVRRAERTFTDATRRIEGSAERAERRTTSLGRSMVAGLAGTAAVLAVRAAIRTADAWQQAGNALASVEVTIGRTVASTDELAEAAIRTRTAFDATVTLYARLERASASLGRSQEEIQRVTELTNMAFVAGGASADEQRSAILQLGQAISSGALQGDELRAIRESAPLVAQAIADAMGVGIGQLRDLGAEGRITADIIIQAILNAGGTIEAQFGAMNLTVAKAMQNLRTSALQAIGGMDDASGATGGLATAIDTLARVIRDNREGLADFASIVAQIATGVAGSLGAIGDFLTTNSREQAPLLQRLADDIAISGGLSQNEVARRVRAEIGLANDELLETLAEVSRIFQTRSLLDRPGELDALGVRDLTALFLGLARAKREAATAGAPAGGAGGSGTGGGVIPTVVSPEHRAARARMDAELELSLARLRNDRDAIALLEDRLDLLARIGRYETAGYSAAEARTRAEADAARITEARAGAAAREIEIIRQGVALEAAAAAEDVRAEESLQRQIDLRARIEAYQEQRLSLTEATAQAEEDIARIEAARQTVRDRMLADAERTHEITLAELAGQERLAQLLNDQAEIERRRREYRDAGGLSDADALARASREVGAEDSARQLGEMRNLFARSFSEGVRAAINGDLSGFLANTFGTLADEAFQRVGEILFDALTGTAADTARATAEGAAQAAAAAPVMTASVQTGGVLAGEAMRAAIVTAGAAAAQSMASAITLASATGGGGKGGFLKTLLKAGLNIAAGGKLPMKAHGGNVNPGQDVIVGENRPEIFRPHRAGRIIPRVPDAAAMRPPASAGTVRFHQTIDLTGANGDEAIRQIAYAASAEGAKQAVMAVEKRRAGRARQT